MKELKIVKYPTITGILFVLLSISAVAVANEIQMSEFETESTITTSSLVAAVSIDSNNNMNKQLSIDYELPQLQHLGFTYINSQSYQSDLDTIQYNFGVSSSLYELLAVSGEYQYWGKKGALETRSLSTELSLNLENWSFSITPQINIVTFYINSRDVNAFDLNSFSTNYSVSYYGWDHFFISADYYENHFKNASFLLDRNRDSIQTRLSRRLSLTTKTLASGLEHSRKSLFASYLFSRVSISAGITKSTTSIIQSESTTTNGSLSYPFTQQIEINFGAGFQTYSEISGGIIFYDIGFTYYW